MKIILIGTGLPSLTAGWNLNFSTASIAISVRPNGSSETGLIAAHAAV